MTNPCIIDDCARPVHAYGYCEMHARRIRAHGDPLHGDQRPRLPCAAPGCPGHAATAGYCPAHAPQHEETCWRCWEARFAAEQRLGYGWLKRKGIFPSRKQAAAHLSRYIPEVARELNTIEATCSP